MAVTPSRAQIPRRESQTKLQRSRRDSTASIASSIGGRLDSNLGTTPEAVNELAHNAIANLNSPPIVRTGLVAHSSLATSSTYRAPSTRDIPPVTLTNIAHIDNAEFKPYLAQVGPLWDTFQRAKVENEQSESTRSKRRESAAEDEFAASFARRRGSDSQQSLTSPVSPGPLSPPESPSVRRTSTSNATSRRRALGPTPLSTVPPVYFEEEFRLENPRTFDVVSERSEIIPPSTREDVQNVNGSARPPVPRGKTLHTNAILQEKLSWYMDTVEVHLIAAIATASSSFFAALSSLKDLQSEAAECIEKIKSLRQALQQLDANIAVGGLEIVKQKQRRQNLRRLAQAVDQLCAVVEEAKSCEDLVEKGQLDEASTRMDDLECLISGEPPIHRPAPNDERLDLRSLRALQGFSEGILSLRARIGRSFELKFIDALLSDIRQHVQKVPVVDTMQRWANATYRNRPEHSKRLDTPAYMLSNDQLRPELLTALAGLSRAGHTSRATSAYRDAVMREIKGMIRKHLPSSSEDDLESTTSTATTSRGARRLNQQEKSAILARNLRALDAEDAEHLLVQVYANVAEALRRLGTQVKVLLDVTMTMDSPRAEKTEATAKALTNTKSANKASRDIREEVAEALDMSSLLGQAVDTVYNQITKVLRVRSEQSSRLPLDQFLRYFVLNRMFADECEAITSRSGDALKSCVNEHVKEFLNHFAEHHRQSINHMLEEDRWDAKDFKEADVVVLSHVLESMTSTPRQWLGYTLLWRPRDSLSDGANDKAVSNGDTGDKIKPAVIDEQRYILVSACMAALRGIESFQKLMTGIPSLTTEITSRLLEYLRFFNSRCCQLILGAGATRSAGLKNITTKHLALASQACSFMIALLPYLREFVRRQGASSVPGILPEFDKVKRLYQDHQNSIRDKLVEIMSSRCNAHVNAMKKVDLNVSNGSEGVPAYVEALCKETATLHRVLSRHLPGAEVEMIMVPILEHYRSSWSEALKAVDVRTEDAKTRLLKDVEHLHDRLGRFDGAKILDASLTNVVKERQVAKENGPPSMDTSQDGSKTSIEIMGNGSMKKQEEDGEMMFDAEAPTPDEKPEPET